MKIKAVFDTNVILSGIIFGGNPRRCLDLVRNYEVELFFSEALLQEVQDKLITKFGYSLAEASLVLKGLKSIASLVTPKVKVSLISDDPSDNKILETAKEAGAEYIVSGDKKHVLVLKQFENVKIVSPAEFLKEVT